MYVNIVYSGDISLTLCMFPTLHPTLYNIWRYIFSCKFNKHCFPEPLLSTSPYGINSESRCNTRIPHLPLVSGLSILNVVADRQQGSNFFVDNDVFNTFISQIN